MEAQPIQANGCFTIGVAKGPISEDALVRINGGMGIKVSLDKGAKYIDQDISIIADMNTEVITRFQTDVQNRDGAFWTDNGSRMIQRARRPRIDASYYPAVHKASIMDDTRRITVLTSQTCGCTSLRPGEIEFMMHRNLQNDDGRGLAEGNMDKTNANLQA